MCFLRTFCSSNDIKETKSSALLCIYPRDGKAEAFGVGGFGQRDVEIVLGDLLRVQGLFVLVSGEKLDKWEILP